MPPTRQSPTCLSPPGGGGATSSRVTCSLSPEPRPRGRRHPAGTHRECGELLRGRRRQQPREQRQPAEPGQQHGEGGARAQSSDTQSGWEPGRGAARGPLPSAPGSPESTSCPPGTERSSASARLPWLLSNNSSASGSLLRPSLPSSPPLRSPAPPPALPAAPARLRCPLRPRGHPGTGLLNQSPQGAHQGGAAACLRCVPASFLHEHTRYTRMHTPHVHTDVHAPCGSSLAQTGRMLRPPPVPGPPLVGTPPTTGPGSPSSPGSPSRVDGT